MRIVLLLIYLVPWWTAFADDLDKLCPIDPLVFDAWPLNQKCEYLHSRIIKAAKSQLLSVTVGNTYAPKKPKDLETLCQSYRFLSKVTKTIRSLHKNPVLYSVSFESKWSSYYIRLNQLLFSYKQNFVPSIVLPSFLRDERIDDFANLLQMLENMTLLLRSLLLLKEKEFQVSSIQAKIDAWNDNFTNDISTFIESALSRTRRRIVLDHPLLTALKNEKKDPYCLVSPMASDIVSSNSCSLDVLEINNLVFMDDSTLISSSKEGMEHMLSITEEFYCLNNTSANHNKYVLATNAVAISRDLSSIAFNLMTSSLNTTTNIKVTPIPMSSSFHFLGVWFNINGSRNFIRQQLKRECNSFSAILRPAKLTVQQVVYLYNTVLLPKLDYRMQVTHLSEVECSTITSSIRALVKHKAKLSRSVPNVVLYLTQALASLLSTPFRLSRAILSPVPDLTYPNGHTPIYQCLSLDVFKANLTRLRKRSLFYLSQLLTPQGTHLLSWSVIYANSIQKRGNARLLNWYKNLSANVTIPDKPGLLKDQFMINQRPVSQIAKELALCTPPSGYKKNWIVTMNDDGFPIFGKQIQLQPKHSICTIVHWTSDCLSRPSDLITLQPCPGCNLNINKSSYSKKFVATSAVSSPIRSLLVTHGFYL
ncbi:hypothetical protein GLOIN_2v1783661 [Rhizophagus irregularis DAOM 181602=DAOM 197198]|nr:hypothetical protein GLOIN_2v1783661 [Rhizophagus irregularis DAOM 181602=DAOM 197198]